MQELEEVQRITQKQVQPPANKVPQRTQGRSASQSRAPIGIPDAIDFLGGRSKGLEVLPGEISQGTGATAWLPFVRQMIIGPGSSGLLAGAYINQFRQIIGSTSATTPNVIDLADLDDAL